MRAPPQKNPSFTLMIFYTYPLILGMQLHSFYIIQTHAWFSLTKVLIIATRTKKSRGFAFVNFTNARAVWKFFDSFHLKKWDIVERLKWPKQIEIVSAKIQVRSCIYIYVLYIYISYDVTIFVNKIGQRSSGKPFFGVIFRVRNGWVSAIVLQPSQKWIRAARWADRDRNPAAGCPLETPP